MHCYVTFQWTTFLAMSLLNVLSIRCSYHSVKTYINFSLIGIRVLCQVNDHKNTCYCFLWFIHQNVSRISLLYQILWSLAYSYPIIIHVTTTRITFVLVNLIWWKSLSATLEVPSRLARVTCWIASSLIKFIDASVVSDYCQESQVSQRRVWTLVGPCRQNCLMT